MACRGSAYPTPLFASGEVQTYLLVEGAKGLVSRLNELVYCSSSCRAEARTDHDLQLLENVPRPFREECLYLRCGDLQRFEEFRRWLKGGIVFVRDVLAPTIAAVRVLFMASSARSPFPPML
jgi:hypothetical protein